MGYSPRQLVKQEPAVIVGIIFGWISVAVVAGWITISSETLAAANSAFLGTLLGFWIRNATVTKETLSQLSDANDAAELRGMAAARPLRADRLQLNDK